MIAVYAQLHSSRLNLLLTISGQHEDLTFWIRVHELRPSLWRLFDFIRVVE